MQCYDEVIISYTESRDVLATPVAFPVPRHIDGFTHVVLLDGCLLGHWRVRRERGGRVDVETRLQRPLDDDARRALDDAISRYHRFVTVPSSHG